jgi:hypothetical protein
MPATPVPKLTTTLVLPWKLIVQQSFQPPAYFVIFSDEFKFTYKTVLFSQTKHLQWLFSHDALKLLLVWFKSFLCLQRLAPRDVQRNFSSGSTG